MARTTALGKAMKGDKVTDKQAQGALGQAVDKIANLTKRAQKSKEAMAATGAMVVHTAETQGSLFLASMAEGYFGTDKLKIGSVDLRAPVGLLAQGYGLYEAMSGKGGGGHALALGNGVMGSWLASVAVQAGRTLAEKRAGGGQAQGQATQAQPQVSAAPVVTPAIQGPALIPGPAGYPARGWARATPEGGGAARAAEPQWPDEDYMPMQPAGPEVYDAEVIEPPDMEDFEDVLEMEGVGALARRWSPLVKMGRNFRIQAAEGYRAAVVPLKPGLFLVAELPEHVARSEFGIAPLLAPLVVRAASRAISKPPGPARYSTRRWAPATLEEGGGARQRPLYRLFHRQGQGQRQQGQGQGRPLLQQVFRPRQGQAQGARQGQGRAFLQRMFRPRQAAMQQPVAQQRSLVPAPGAGHAQNQLLPAPALGAWVDPEDLAGLFDDGQGG